MARMTNKQLIDHCNSFWVKRVSAGIVPILLTLNIVEHFLPNSAQPLLWKTHDMRNVIQMRR